MKSPKPLNAPTAFALTLAALMTLTLAFAGQEGGEHGSLLSIALGTTDGNLNRPVLERPQGGPPVFVFTFPPQSNVDFHNDYGVYIEWSLDLIEWTSIPIGHQNPDFGDPNQTYVNGQIRYALPQIENEPRAYVRLRVTMRPWFQPPSPPPTPPPPGGGA